MTKTIFWYTFPPSSTCNESERKREEKAALFHHIETMTYRKTVTILVIASVFAVLMIGFLGYGIVRAVTISIDEDSQYPIERVIDGDTFTAKIGWHEITVRMLGIDTPETVDPRKPVQCFGKEASDQTKNLLNGKAVQLKFNPNREKKDKYGRYLAYVYAGDLFVNEFLLENGYAREYTYGKPYIFQKDFREIEKIAKDSKKGLWGKCAELDYKTNR